MKLGKKITYSIAIFNEDGGITSRQVEGLEIAPGLAVRKEGEKFLRQWKVDHVPTGGYLLACETRKHAIEVVRQLAPLWNWTKQEMPKRNTEAYQKIKEILINNGRHII